jgi:hypothetical protein
VEQAEFQSMVSGEDIQVNTKYAKARSEVWKVPGVLAGNEVRSGACATRHTRGASLCDGPAYFFAGADVGGQQRVDPAPHHFV